MKLTPAFTLVKPFAVLSLLLTACSGDDGEPTPTRPPMTATVAAESTPTPQPEASPAPVEPTAQPNPTQAPSPTPGAGAALDSLALVYVDTRRGQGGDVYVAEANGSNPRLVTSEGAFRRPLDVMGGTLGAVGQEGVMLIDLASGETTLLEESLIVFDGRFLDDETFLYSLSGSCTQGGGALYRVDIPSGEVEELLSSELSLTLAGVEATTNSITVLPRGCDVGINGLEVYDAASGELRNSLAVQGCGWAIAVPEHNKAVASWQACTPPDEHAGADATVYDFGIVGPTGNDVTAPDEGSNAAIWLPRPRAPKVALATTTTSGSGPGSTRSGGLYLLDLNTREFEKVVDGEGAEQFPVSWSPDGRHLLYATVAAQGLCSFAFIDVEAPETGPVAVNPEVTFCGINGHVVGWTELQ